ncbi:ATP phosphoribosyltransferase [Fusibacter bizertensis]|uniref:ATP phosphoribosyltransferase n=1 Tax=Fusibacter bizertensis TaxID=1488331 RepID=A0ABT6NCS2_9FIRM|nr:ATP phosphoribosyltransferase [Fusibacter bizertensis]MDH8678210.1 ATP phosphoribosyltransferase [Fusibacter bizertensis]
MLKFAIAKGRITKDSKELLTCCGFDMEEVNSSRKLILYNADETISLILLKAGDIPLYVANGAVDIGLVGKDTVLENDLDVYELTELDFAKCTLCVAGPKEKVSLKNGVRIATKYPELTKKFTKRRGIVAEIITLSGSIELAPLIHLSDCIVDLVQTGETLRENDLIVYEEILSIAPMIIANKVSYRTKSSEVDAFINICERFGK